MKTKNIILILLLSLSIGFVTAHDKVEWFPIGATWHYQFRDGGWGMNLQLRTFVVEKDTVIDGKNARVIRGENIEHIVYENNGRVYYYFQGKYRKIFDFSVGIGDIVEFEFKTIKDLPDCYPVDCWDHSTFDLDTTIVLPMQIERISTRIIDGVELREILASYFYEGTYYAWQFQHHYIEKIGVDYSFNQRGIFPVMPSWGIALWDATRLRCYRDDDIEYITNWWISFGEGRPCDYDPTSSVRQPETNQDIVLFPNPAQNILTISAKTEILQKVNISIHDVTGKVVFEKNAHLPFELNVEHLQSGVYFIRIFDEGTRRLSSKKFIKK